MMYAVEFRVVSTAQEMAPARQTQTESVSPVKEVTGAVDFTGRQLGPLPSQNTAPVEDRQRELQEALDQMAGAGRYIRFDMHKETGALIIRICDSHTNEVIREVPPEKILDMVGKFCELAGLLVDKKV